MNYQTWVKKRRCSVLLEFDVTNIWVNVKCIYALSGHIPYLWLWKLQQLHAAFCKTSVLVCSEIVDVSHLCVQPWIFPGVSTVHLCHMATSQDARTLQALFLTTDNDLKLSPVEVSVAYSTEYKLFIFRLLQCNLLEGYHCEHNVLPGACKVFLRHFKLAPANYGRLNAFSTY